jgi:ADP-heptose:LPS heptosyltransferase
MDSILEKLKKDKIQWDCMYYSGYKPCGKSEFCEDCGHYVPKGKKILIIKLAALGDVLRTAALLPGIKKKYPQSFITWITDENAVPLLENNSMIDRLRVFDATGILTAHKTVYDIVLNFEKEDRALALMDFVCAKEKMGFAFSKEYSLFIANDASLYALQLGLNDELKFHHNQKTYQEIIYEMAEIPYNGEEYTLELSEDSIKFSDKMKSTLPFNKGRFRIGLNTGCGSIFQTKKWTQQGFIELAEKLLKDGDCDVLLLGGPREREFNKSIKEHFPGFVIDTGCDNSLEEFMGIVSLCDLVVSSDSLASHISVALKKETIVLLGSTCHQEIDLYGRGEKIVSDFPCSPCYKKTCSRKPTCMESMDAETVYKAVRRRIDVIKSLRV